MIFPWEKPSVKTAIVSDFLPRYHRTWSGAEMIAMTLSQMLKSRGCEVFFATIPFDFPETKDNGCRVCPVNTPLKKLGTISRNFPVDVAAINNLYQLFKRERPEVVHINAKYLFLPAMIACKLLGIATAFTVPDYFILCPTTFLRKTDDTICSRYQGGHCLECISALNAEHPGSMENVLHKLIKKTPKFILGLPFYLRAEEFNYFISQVDAFVTLSKSSQKRMIDYGIPAGKVSHIYHYKLGRPQETKVEMSSPAIMFAGKLCKENGTDVLLSAFAETRKHIPQARLYLIGWAEESYKVTLENAIRELGPEAVTVLGKRENAEILSLISKSDAVVVPHQWPKEFGPVILIEALACGKPVITSRIGGTDEFVTDNETGFLVEDYRNPTAFAEKMVYLLSNPSRLKEMGEKGKEKVSFLSDGTSEDKLLEMYNRITRKKHSRQGNLEDGNAG